jgi:hypothetical protein
MPEENKFVGLDEKSHISCLCCSFGHSSRLSFRAEIPYPGNGNGMIFDRHYIDFQYEDGKMLNTRCASWHLC